MWSTSSRPTSRLSPRWSQVSRRQKAERMERIQVTIAPEPHRVRMLATADEGDLLKAILGPARACHPRAAATMLEGLALWHQRPLSVVLCADESAHSSALDLYDALGAGVRTLHYEVAVAFHPHSLRRQRNLRGLGDFRGLRQLVLPGVPR
jgi:hypothetical protein